MSLADAAIVTGAGRGIGRAIAERLGAHGLDILCLSQSDRALETAAGIVAAGGSAQGVVADIANLDEVNMLVRTWLETRRTARIGTVLAAATLGPSGPLIDTDLGEWSRVFHVNVLGNLAVVQAALPTMYSTGFGRVVAFAGGGAAYAYPILPGYAVSKTAMVRAVENLAADFADHRGDLTAVCIAPGAVETDTLAEVRRLGAEVRTTVDVDEPVRCVTELITGDPGPLNGRFIHVRDDWPIHLNRPRNAAPLIDDQWKLRRVE